MDEPSPRKYHVAHHGRKFGPLSLVELSSRRLSHDMLVWCEGMPEWVPIGTLPELQPYVRHAAPARTVAPPTPGNTAGQSAAGQSAAGPPARRAVSRPDPAAQPGGVWAAGGGPPPPPAGNTGRLSFVAITSIVLGGLGLVGCPLSGAGQFLNPLTLGVADFVSLNRTVYITLWTVLYSLFTFVSLAMVIAGIGLLRKCRWAATTSIVASVACLAGYLVAAVFQTFFVLLPVVAKAVDAGENPGLALVAGGLNLVAVAMVVGLVWHAVSIMLVNSPPVRAHLR